MITLRAVPSIVTENTTRISPCCLWITHQLYDLKEEDQISLICNFRGNLFVSMSKITTNFADHHWFKWLPSFYLHYHLSISKVINRSDDVIFLPDEASFSSFVSLLLVI